MAESRALAFLKIATKNNLLSPEQAEQILKGIEDRRALGVERSPADIAKEKSFLRDEEIAKINGILRGMFPPEQLAGYKVGEVVGSGAVGTVYRGRQISLDKAVAIKILHASLSAHPRHVQGFIDEARAAARLNHPNIVQAFDAGAEQEYNYFVMEYVHGESLGALLRRAGRLAEPKVIDIALEVAKGLEHAHQNKLLHRDLKPDNILIGKDGQIKIADLGLAIPLEDAELLAEEHKRMGTPFYLSPEQAQGKEIVPQSDLYALGATMYHMLAGRPPFTGNNVKEILTKQVHQDPIPLDELHDDITHAMGMVVLKLLSKDPGARYATPTELIAALREVREAPLAAANPPPRRGIAPPKRPEPPARTIAREKGSAASSTVTVAPKRTAARAGSQGESARSATGEVELKLKEKKKGPGMFTIAGTVLGIIISLIFFMLAVNRNSSAKKAERMAEARKVAASVSQGSFEEDIATRRKQWINEKITKPRDEMASALSASKNEKGEPDRLLSMLFDALKNKPDAPNALEIIPQTAALRKKTKDLEAAAVNATVIDVALGLWEKGEYKDAYRMLEKNTDWPLEMRTEDAKKRASEILDGWDEWINKKWATDNAQVQDLRAKKSYDQAIAILQEIPKYADFEKVTKSEKTLIDVEEEKKNFLIQERERITKQNEQDYKAFLNESMALCQIRDFQTCLDKAKKMESTVENDTVRKDLRRDIEALTVVQGFMDTFIAVLEKEKGGTREFNFKMTNDTKQIGSVERIEKDRVYLTMKRGGGVAALPVEFSKIIDESIFKVVATEVGEKTSKYLIPIALMNAYRGNLDVARAILTQASSNGIDVSQWTEKLNALQAAKG